jgi:GNAT superfamily N-acetyltransferase
MFPDEIMRIEKAPHIFETQINFGIKFGKVYVTNNFEGVSVWIHPKYIGLSIMNMLRAGAGKLLFKIGLRSLPRILGTYELSRIHKKLVREPHWYLMVIGVNPDKQKNGYGTALIDHMLTKIDNQALSCYLEVGKEENLAFYKRFGFKIIHETYLEKLDVKSWSLFREAKEK